MRSAPIQRKPHLFGSVLLLSLLTEAADAQHVIASAGGEFTNAAHGIAFTIGEPVIGTELSATSIITQGFHQPSADISTDVGTVTDPSIEVNVYPVPTGSELNVVLGGSDGLISMEILDAAGRTVIQHGGFSQRTALSVEALSSGCYTLRLSHNGRAFSTTQLIITR